MTEEYKTRREFLNNMLQYTLVIGALNLGSKAYSSPLVSNKESFVFTPKAFPQTALLYGSIPESR